MLSLPFRIFRLSEVMMQRVMPPAMLLWKMETMQRAQPVVRGGALSGKGMVRYLVRIFASNSSRVGRTPEIRARRPLVAKPLREHHHHPYQSKEAHRTLK